MIQKYREVISCLTCICSYMLLINTFDAKNNLQCVICSAPCISKIVFQFFFHAWCRNINQPLILVARGKLQKNTSNLKYVGWNMKQRNSNPQDMHYIIALHCEYLRNWVGRISTNKTITLTQRDSVTLWRRNSTQIYIFSLQMCIPTVSLYVSSYVGFKLRHYSFKVEKDVIKLLIIIMCLWTIMHDWGMLCVAQLTVLLHSVVHLLYVKQTAVSAKSFAFAWKKTLQVISIFNIKHKILSPLYKHKILSPL